FVVAAVWWESADRGRLRDAKERADDFPVPRYCQRGRAARIRAKYSGSLSSGWSHGAQGAARCQGGRVAGGTADPLPAGGEPQDREGARSRPAVDRARPRRRGDRVTGLLLHLLLHLLTAVLALSGHSATICFLSASADIRDRVASTALVANDPDQS